MKIFLFNEKRGIKNPKRVSFHLQKGLKSLTDKLKWALF